MEKQDVDVIAIKTKFHSKVIEFFRKKGVELDEKDIEANLAIMFNNDGDVVESSARIREKDSLELKRWYNDGKNDNINEIIHMIDLSNGRVFAFKEYEYEDSTIIVGSIMKKRTNLELLRVMMQSKYMNNLIVEQYG